mgnify:CR=1 FL=1
MSSWKSFGVDQIAWSQFVFDTLQFWRWIPKLEIILLIYTLAKFQKKTVLLSLIINLIIICALLWAIYAPALMIN